MTAEFWLGEMIARHLDLVSIGIYRSGDFLGNAFVSELTNRYQVPYRLLIELIDASNNTYYLNYEIVEVKDELNTNFTISLTNFSSTNGARKLLAQLN